MSTKALVWVVRSALWACMLIALVGIGVANLAAQTATVRARIGNSADSTATRPIASVGTVRCTYYQPVVVGGNASDGWTFTPSGDPLVGGDAHPMVPLMAWEFSDGSVVSNTVVASAVEWGGSWAWHGYDATIRVGLVPGDPVTESGRVYVGSRSKTNGTVPYTYGWRTFPEETCRFGMQYGCMTGSEHGGRAGPILPFVVLSGSECGSGYTPCTPLDTWITGGMVTLPAADSSGNAVVLGTSAYDVAGSNVDPTEFLEATANFGAPVCIGIRIENSGVNEFTVYSSTGFRARSSSGIITFKLDSSGMDFPWLKFTINPGESPWSVVSTLEDDGIIAAINAHKADAHSDAAAILDALTADGAAVSFTAPTARHAEILNKANEVKANAITAAEFDGPAVPSVPAARSSPVYEFEFDTGMGETVWSFSVDMAWYEPYRPIVRYLLLVPFYFVCLGKVWNEIKRQ